MTPSNTSDFGANAATAGGGGSSSSSPSAAGSASSTGTGSGSSAKSRKSSASSGSSGASAGQWPSESGTSSGSAQLRAGTGSAGTGSAGTGSEDPGDLAGETRKLAGVGSRLAGHWLDQRKNALTETFNSTAEGLRRLGESFNDQPNLKTYIDAAAEGIEAISEEISNQQLEDLARQAESVSRTHPVAVFAGAVAAGVVMSRILRGAAEGGLRAEFSNGGRQGGRDASGRYSHSSRVSSGEAGS